MASPRVVSFSNAVCRMHAVECTYDRLCSDTRWISLPRRGQTPSSSKRSKRARCKLFFYDQPRASVCARAVAHVCVCALVCVCVCVAVPCMACMHAMHVSTHPHTLTGNQSTHTRARTGAHRITRPHARTPARHSPSHHIPSLRCGVLPTGDQPGGGEGRVPKAHDWRRRVAARPHHQARADCRRVQARARTHARTHAHLIALIHTHACGRVYNDTRARTRAQITELSLSGECVATFRRVRDHCIDRGILFMSTPFDTDRAAADRCQAIC